MEKGHNRLFYILYVLVAATCVYLFAHWGAITNEYVINDDVRQQIYWMQSWSDPELFRDDLLSRYSRNYVPWGVQAIYAIGSKFMNPVQFTKVVTGMLFVVTAGFLFGLGRELLDDLTGVLVVCIYFLFGVFLDRMSGGLSRGFVYPLIVAYLYFLSKNQVFLSGLVILLQSLINPYAFLVCLFTHAMYIAHFYGKALLEGPRAAWRTRWDTSPVEPEVSHDLAQEKQPGPETDSAPGTRTRALFSFRNLAWMLPVIAGFVLVALKYVLFKSHEFGDVVTLADMAGKIEYTDKGRYGIVPVPSLLIEIVRPWIPSFVHGSWRLPIGWTVFSVVIATAVWAFSRDTKSFDLKKLRVFAYLLVASLVLYGLAHLMLMKLFLPRRYLEYSLNIFYCVLVGVCLRLAIEHYGLRRFAFPLIASVLVLVGAIRLHNVGLFDYSKSAPLCQFMESTPKNSVVAGHPDLMDNVTTFARRKAFVTYELSHTWYTTYWETIKGRTLGFFKAYYSDDPEVIRRFCRENNIDYLVVREKDFRDHSIKKKQPYFEPFGKVISDLTTNKSGFSVLDGDEFPPVYQNRGIRVLKPNSTSP
jgi:hypothetical protein